MGASPDIVLAAMLVAVVAPNGAASTVSATPRETATARKAQVFPESGCLRARVPLRQDSIPDPADFEGVACDAQQTVHAWRYDPSSGSTRLARDIAAGEIVPRFPGFGGDMVMPGQMLSLVVAVGHVRIERPVEAMQAARPGQRLFVKSRDGKILSVRYEAAAR